jgi:hypothetical protein
VRRASPNGGEELLGRARIARDQELDAPVRAILDPAGETKRIGSLANEPAKTDPLDPPDDTEVVHRHHRNLLLDA